MDGPPSAPWTAADRNFARAAVQRKRIFLVLSAAGVVVGLTLAVYYAYQRIQDPGYAVGVRAVLVILILLNARQNLRQYRYARLIEPHL